MRSILNQTFTPCSQITNSTQSLSCDFTCHGEQLRRPVLFVLRPNRAGRLNPKINPPRAPSPRGFPEERLTPSRTHWPTPCVWDFQEKHSEDSDCCGPAVVVRDA